MSPVDNNECAKQEDINSLVGEIDRMSMQSTPSLTRSEDLGLNLSGRPSRDVSRLSGKTSSQSLMKSIRFGGYADDNDQTDVEATSSELQNLDESVSNSSSNSDTDETVIKRSTADSMPSYSVTPTPTGDNELQFNSAASMSRRRNRRRRRGSRISFDDNDTSNSEQGLGLNDLTLNNEFSLTPRRGKKISFKDENSKRSESDRSGSPLLTPNKMQEVFSFFDENQVDMTSSGFL